MSDDSKKDDGGDVVPLRRGVDALVAFVRAQSFGGPRDRAYVGQAHTYLGERGRRLVDRTYRDVGDAIAQEVARAAGGYAPGLAGVDVDWEAFVQNVLVRIETDQSASGRVDYDSCPTCKQDWPRRGGKP